MTPKHLIPGIFSLLVIATVLMAGCTFLPFGSPAAPTSAPTQAPTAAPSAVPTTLEEVSQTCPDLGGTTCGSAETCTGNLVRSSDGLACCQGTCSPAGAIEPVPATTGGSQITTVNPTATNPVAAITAPPVTMPQSVPTGSITAAPTATVAAVQTYEVVMDNTCPAIGGNICLSDETCSGSLIKTTDSDRCCAGTCLLPSYVVTPTPESTVIPSVAKTCEEIGGNICSGGTSCTGGLVKTTDSDTCCAGTCA